MNSRNLTFHQECSIIFWAVFSAIMFLVSKHILNLQIARNTQGLLLDAKQFAFEQEIAKKNSSGWEYHSTTFVQVDLHSFNELYRCSRQISTFFSQKSRLCVRSDTSAFSVLVIVSPYFQITIVPRNFFKKKVL